MKKKLLSLMAITLIASGLANANDYKCTADGYNSNTKHNLYSKGDFVMTNSDDTYKCDNYWMQGNTLDAGGGNDKIYISKNTGKKKLTINMGDGDDTFYHTFYKIQLNGTTINGGNGNDTVNISGANKEDFEIIGDCKKKCTIKNKKSSYLLKNVTLTSIENLVFNGKKVITTNTNTNTNTNTTININNYPKIDLSSYETIIPAYWWSHTLNNKLTELKSHSAIVIVNPNNGDFSKTEDIFKEEIKDTQSKNNLAIGYVHTGYGKRNKDEVKKSINNWLKYYPNIKGFFLDEASNTKDKLEYYKEIYNYIKLKNPNLVVVINPGTTPDKGYFNVADNIIVYENPCSDYDNYTMPEWEKTYKDNISFLGYNCNQEQYNKLENKYGQYTTYFTDDGADGNPWDGFSKYLINNTSITINTAEEKYAPYDSEKFHNILDVAKLTYPDGHTLIRKNGDYEGYKSDFFYATKDGNMVFAIKKHEGKYKARVELRQRINGKDDGWKISENKVHTLKEKVKLQKLSGTNGEEYTFSQIHSEVNPLVRLAVEKEKNGKTDHIWAIVRINTNSSGKRTNRYDLGKVNPDNFDSFTIKVGNNNLTILRNGKEYVNKDVSYWTEIKNYFKAGIYLSHASHNPDAYEVKDEFNELTVTENTIVNNNTDSNNNTNDTVENTTTENTTTENTTTENTTTENTTTENTTTNNNSNNNIDTFFKKIENVNQNSNGNIWENKIKNLNFEKLSIDLGQYNKYYKIFEKFFNDKKQKILDKTLANEDYFNYLHLFNTYTNWVFTDIYNKNYSNIKSYLDGFKKIVNKLKAIK